MKPLAIIPVKAKSNRLPNKNMKSFFGKPLYEWSAYEALNSGIFGEIVITTNIKEINLRWQFLSPTIHVVDRPQYLATDEATMLDVVLDLLKYYSDYDSFCVLYPTAPLRTADDIRKSYKLFVDGEYEGVIGGTKFIQPWWQSFERSMNGYGKYWQMNFPHVCESREEEVPKRLTDNGSLYWMQTEAFLEQKTFFPQKLGIYEMPYERSIDINTEVDFELAEFFAKK